MTLLDMQTAGKRAAVAEHRCSLAGLVIATSDDRDARPWRIVHVESGCWISGQHDGGSGKGATFATPEEADAAAVRCLSGVDWRMPGWELRDSKRARRLASELARPHVPTSDPRQIDIEDLIAEAEKPSGRRG